MSMFCHNIVTLVRYSGNNLIVTFTLIKGEKIMKYKLLLLTLLITAYTGFCNENFIIKGKDLILRINPKTLEMTVEKKDFSFQLSDSVINSKDYTVNNNIISYKDIDLIVEVNVNEFIEVKFETDSFYSITWPKVSLTKKDFLILPHNEGSYIPIGDKDWKRFLTESEFDTTAGLTMPFWGIERNKKIVSYIFKNPYNNTLQFKNNKKYLDLILTNTPPKNKKKKTIQEFSIYLDNNHTPIAPGLRFREMLIQNGDLISLDDKIKKNPNTKMLIGAPHSYVWESGLISIYDIKGGAENWIDIGKIIIDSPYFSNILTDGEVELLTELSKIIYPNKYIKKETAKILSKLYISHKENFIDILGKYLKPQERWGDGVSTKIVDKLSNNGIDRFLFTIDGKKGVEHKSWVADYAYEKGYLLGIYDSFHSIHNPKYKGTDSSWETAQYDKELYQIGGILGKDGKVKKGFKQIGKKLSPITARPWVERRVRDNFSKVDYSYYFVDCDAYGEFYDDYNPDNLVFMNEDANERISRVKWINNKFKIPVGSEGGFYQFSSVITVAEGVFFPVLGWGDKDMNNRESKFFVGRYWPEDEPEIFFKPVPLKDKYIKLYVDPKYRIPLYESVFHDSVITSSHWQSSTLKFSNVTETVQLLEKLYQIPSLFHLNLNRIDEDMDTIKKSYKFFNKYHKFTYKYNLSDFKYLDSKRLVQLTSFGPYSFIGNFSNKVFNYNNKRIEPMSVVPLL